MLGPDPEPVIQGIRQVGAQQVTFIGAADQRATYEKVRDAMAGESVKTEFVAIEGDALLATIRTIQRITGEAGDAFDDVLVNLGSADRGMTCAGLSAAFVAGVKAFDVVDGEVLFLPVLKFSFRDVVSDAKIGILQALEELGGSTDRLKTLARSAGLQDSLVSYHIRGGREGRGLEDLGLVDVSRGTRGALTIELTPMGELLARGMGP